MGGHKKRKTDKKLARRIEAWTNSLSGRGRGGGIQTSEDSFHKPGSRSGRK